MSCRKASPGPVTSCDENLPGLCIDQFCLNQILSSGSAVPLESDNEPSARVYYNSSVRGHSIRCKRNSAF